MEEEEEDAIAGSVPRDNSVLGVPTATAPPSGCPTSSFMPPGMFPASLWAALSKSSYDELTSSSLS